MARRVPVDKLTTEIEKILQEYGDDVQDNLNDIVAQISKKGAQTLKSQSRSTFGGTGAYASGWTSQTETGRVSAQGTIYNKISGLPHLLEHGHALRNGGRTQARPHISVVEQTLIKEFESKVKSKL